MTAEEFLDESILVGVRPLCNVDADDEAFDQQLIPIVNGQIMIAHQFGVGYNGFVVGGTGETWRQWLGDNGYKLAAIKSWLGLSTRMLFDPPKGGEAESIQRTIDKYEMMLRDKSQFEGYVKEYVPEHADFYNEI